MERSLQITTTGGDGVVGGGGGGLLVKKKGRPRKYESYGVVADHLILVTANCLLLYVVDEVLTRQKVTEWFIEGDFDAYVERIRKPYVWGGELELLMASHLLK
ncbi:OTU domain-containing protein [Camellia lanceoleosa]|uniref:OTU domain-containing protein n=1 Tax=Camellia lanceoleosa TaxID=1840588 RepID=A0ACC0GRP4_9ERIC|nr:OTU domain-containing protein [Camellia lanceoleosa]